MAKVLTKESTKGSGFHHFSRSAIKYYLVQQGGCLSCQCIFSEWLGQQK